jgi:N utilization substance protein B
MAEDHAGRQLSRRRRAARKLLTQALYQLQVGAQPWQDIHHQHVADPESEGADLDYFREVLMQVATNREALDAALAPHSDIAPERLDPIEHAILWLAMYELQHRPDVPFRVAISEAVDLAKRFGATDGFKYVNGVLDRAARVLRPHERDF